MGRGTQGCALRLFLPFNPLRLLCLCHCFRYRQKAGLVHRLPGPLCRFTHGKTHGHYPSPGIAAARYVPAPAHHAFPGYPYDESISAAGKGSLLPPQPCLRYLNLHGTACRRRARQHGTDAFAFPALKRDSFASVLRGQDDLAR